MRDGAKIINHFSKRMRVPDRLLLMDDAQTYNNGYSDQQSKKETASNDMHRMMTVPDRILVFLFYPFLTFGQKIYD